MSYNVFKIRYTLAMSDPDMPGPRYHNVIFVETQKDGSGIVPHVTGDITSGMVYATKQVRSKDDDRRRRILSMPKSFSPPPPKQKHFNTRTMRTEQMKPDGSFYESGEPRPPMIKCTEWTEEQAIPALYNSGILRRA
ncbi:uncharacterized protein RSE6_14145 [Rhynchosporium secalis]|uniref:Uncharacterized protein n=1 Tax=Rhynchosporium secalis TaxID=38038 RepID=A0A1E1MUJ3_RHYSE|nr:uncharacterized protein RSE6_14145 [Rhynchosporium secalis]